MLLRFRQASFFIGVILFISLLVLPSSKSATHTVPKLKNITQFETMTHKLLNLTRNNGLEVSDNSYKLLDRLIYISEIKLKEQGLLAKESYSKSEAQKVLGIIAESLKDENFKIEEITFVVQALEQKTYDCDTGANLYLSIVEALGLPINLYMVELPDHVFLRWRKDQEYFNWEVLQSRVVSDEFYTNSYNFTEEDIANKLFLRELNQKETESHDLQTLALYLYEKNKYLKAIKVFGEAISLDINNHKAFNNRGLVFNRVKVYRLAKKDFMRASEIHPKIAHIYYNLGNTFLREQNLLEAYMNYSKAIHLDPGFKLARTNLNILHSYLSFTGGSL